MNIFWYYLKNIFKKRENKGFRSCTHQRVENADMIHSLIKLLTMMTTTAMLTFKDGFVRIYFLFL